MIQYSGRALIILIIAFATVGLVDYFFLKELRQQTDLYMAVTSLIPGLIITTWGFALYRKKNNTEIVIDPDTGAEIEYERRPSHTLFSIPIQYYGLFIIAIGVFFLIKYIKA